MTRKEMFARGFTANENGKVIDDMGNEWRNEQGEVEYLREVNDIDEITEKFFDMSAQGKTGEEIMKATGITKIEEDESQTVITIHYPNGEIVSHWV